MQSITRRFLCGTVALALGASPAGASAGPPKAGAEAADEAPEAGADAAIPDAGADATGPAGGAEAGPQDGDEPAETEPAPPPPPTVGGVAGNPVADDEEARQAEAELEGRAGAPARDVPDRMPPLQAAAWWTLFGGVAIASIGGVMGGMAESEEDKARRLATEVDAMTGAAPEYESVQEDYENALDRGRTFERTAWALVGVAGVTLVTSLAMFAVHGKRKREADRSARLRPRGLEVRF